MLSSLYRYYIHYYYFVICNLNYITAGSLALLMHFEDGEFAKSSHNRYVLDEQVSIYGLPPIGGVPREITDARATCANRDNSAFLNPPTAD